MRRRQITRRRAIYHCHAAPMCLVICMAMLAVFAPARAAEPYAVKHPNLLLNREEIEQIKVKVREQPWAANLLTKVRALADQEGHTGREPRDAAVVYALTGERKYADAVRQELLGRLRGEKPKYDRLDIKADPQNGSFGPWAQWAWAYDLTYDTFSNEERKTLESFLGVVAHAIIDGATLQPTTAGLVFEKHWKVALIGYCLGDDELINWGLHDPGAFGSYLGGVYTLFDANFRDEMFWSESPHYGMGVVLQGFLAVAEAALHYDGTDLYHYKSPKSGGSIKGLFDGYLRIAYSREATGINGGSLRLVTYGDGCTGYTPTGQQTDTYLINAVRGGPKLPPNLNGEFEIAYKRFGDPGYAWLLGLNPNRDGYISGDRSVWGYAALTHGQPLPDHPTPPPAPSGDYPNQGLAVLRADESPAYWTSDATTAVLRLGAAVGHGHNDYYHLMLHGKGRLLYPTMQLIQYEPNYVSWTREGISCNTLLVDHQSPRPGPVTTRHDFAPGAKFFAVTGSAFDGVTQTRALVLTPEYLVDIFRAADDRGRRHTFDWLLHGLGRLYPGNPGAYKPTNELVPFYWWVDNERGRTTEQSWQADWVQHSAGVIPGAQQLGKEWFDHTAAVRMTMLGQSGTEVYCGDGPIVDAPPYAKLDGDPEGTVPMVVARRACKAATFIAVHEPYETKPAISKIARIAETDEAIGVAIAGDRFSDRVLVSFSGDKDQTLQNAGETFTFRDHATIRCSQGHIAARGNVASFRIRPMANVGAVDLVVNGTAQPVRVEGGFVIFGNPPVSGAVGADTAFKDDPAERAACVHYSFLPEEVHLKSGGQRGTSIHLRCVGATPAGGIRGSIQFTAPTGITVEPASIDMTSMNEGDEKDISVQLKSDAGLPPGLYPVQIESPTGIAAAGELPVSVGVVITRDTRLPLMAQSVIRAPGYTMKLDHRSGVACYLLDADGHRRHGHIRDDSGNCTGFFALAKGSDWLLNYELPIRFVFDGFNNGALSIVIAPGRGDRVRPRYTFYDDRIVMTLTESAEPDGEYELYLGDFDVLGQPRLHPTGTQRKGKETAVMSEAVFYPHPLFRQGLLITFPEPRPICSRGSTTHFSIRAGRDVTLQFAEGRELPQSLKESSAPAKGDKSPDRGNKKIVK